MISFRLCKQLPARFWAVYSLLILSFCACKQVDSEAEATAAPLAISEGEISVADGQLYYKRMGAGEPILLIHGGPGLDHSYFLPQMSILADQYELIFYDQRACGKSTTKGDSSDISIQQFVADIEAIRAASGHDQVHLMAHSWGGLLGMYYAATHPGKLKSLVLMNAMSPSFDLRAREDSIQASQTAAENRKAMNDIMQSTAFQNREISAYEALFREMFRGEFYAQSYADSLTLTFPESFVQNSQSLQYLGKDLASYDVREQLEHISCPSLIIYGDQEVGSNIAGPAIHARIPDSRLEIMENCGHFPFVEAQDAFKQLVLDFYAQH